MFSIEIIVGGGITDVSYILRSNVFYCTLSEKQTIQSTGIYHLEIIQL